MKRNELVERVADYMIEEGRNETQYGTYIFTFDELASVMYKDMDYTGDIPAEHWLIKNYRSIQDALDEHEELLEPAEESHDEDGFLDGFDLNFGLAYCPNLDWSAWEGLEVDHMYLLLEEYEQTGLNFDEIVEALEYHYSLNKDKATDLANVLIKCETGEEVEELLNPQEGDERTPESDGNEDEAFKQLLLRGYFKVPGLDELEDDEDESESDEGECIDALVEKHREASTNYTQALELLADVLCDYDDKIVTWGDDWDEDELKSFTEPRDKLAKAIELLSRPTEMVRVNYSVHTEEEDDDDVLTDVSEAKALDFLIGLADTNSSIWSVERVSKGTPSPWGKWFPPYID